MAAFHVNRKHRVPNSLEMSTQISSPRSKSRNGCIAKLNFSENTSQIPKNKGLYWFCQIKGHSAPAWLDWAARSLTLLAQTQGNTEGPSHPSNTCTVPLQPHILLSHHPAGNRVVNTTPIPVLTLQAVCQLVTKPVLPLFTCIPHLSLLFGKVFFLLGAGVFYFIF